jgi:hypothetical protein
MNWLRAHLVEDWQECLKWSSVRLHLIVAFLSGLFCIAPELDPNIAGMLPAKAQSAAIGVYALMALGFRLTKLKNDA